MMWNAWDAVRGMPREEARARFLALAVPVLEQKGIPAEDPERAEKEAEFYKQCQDRLPKTPAEKPMKKTSNHTGFGVSVQSHSPKI